MEPAAKAAHERREVEPDLEAKRNEPVLPSGFDWCRAAQSSFAESWESLLRERRGQWVAFGREGFVTAAGTFEALIEKLNGREDVITRHVEPWLPPTDFQEISS